jgi:hypothetical protein
MPQDGSQNYYYPPGTRGIPDETIESAAYNDFLDDLVDHDLNIPRPIHRGGTGANNADQALINLGAEKATQLVTNYDTHVWLPGSFRSTSSATGGPVGSHAFAGIVYINEPFLAPPTNANVTVSARDMDDTVVPGRVYVREKKADVWGAWTVVDASTLPFPPGGDLEATTILAAIQELDAEKASIVYVDDEIASLLTHVDDEIAGLLTHVDEVDATKVAKSGDTMSGHLSLPTDPAADQAVRKDYVDVSIANISSLTASLAGLAASGIQINGGMEVSQELNLTTTVLPGSNMYIYAVDGFFAFYSAVGAGTTATATCGQVQVGGHPAGHLTAAVISNSVATVSPGTNNHQYFQMPLEQARTRFLCWGTANAQPITIGFWITSNRAGTMALVVQNGAKNRSYVVNISVASGFLNWQYKTIVIPGDTVPNWVGNAVGMRVILGFGTGGGLVTATPDTWVAGSALATSSTSNWFLTTGDIYVTGLTITPGAHVITAIQSSSLMRPYDAELQLCQRYYEISQNKALVWSGNIVSGNPYFAASGFATEKLYSTPSISYTDHASSGFNALPFFGASYDHRGVEVERLASATASYGYFQTRYVVNARILV